MLTKQKNKSPDKIEREGEIMKVINIILIGLLLIGIMMGCAEETTEPCNKPPDVPTNLSPPNGATNISPNPTLSWSCSDPDGDPLVYDVYFCRDLERYPDLILVSENQTDTTYTPGPLETQATYYWKIVAKDDHYRYSESPVLHFTVIALEGNTVIVNSNPSGASIYLDGTNMNQVTPYTLTEVEAGNHHIRLYKEGYNEYNEYFTLEEGGSYVINAELGVPVPPIPVIEIYHPLDGASFSDNVITLEGFIRVDDGTEDGIPFTGDHAILTLNGVDQEIPVLEGYFNQEISITSGENTIRVRANSYAGNTGVSDLITVIGDFTAPDIEITLTWNTPTSDIDLHIWNPLEEHCYYGNMYITEGSLDIDDVEGYGPETFTAQNAIDGTYVVKVNCYDLDQDDYADATVKISLNGGNIDTYGPHHFNVADYNGNDPEAWWEVTSFTMSAGMKSFEVKPISEEMAKKIIENMKNLPPK